MATINNDNPGGPETFSERLSTMQDHVLVAQELVQQGAVNAVSWLLENGCTEANAGAMLDSLRINAALIREEIKRRGKTALFDNDQVADTSGAN